MAAPPEDAAENKNEIALVSVIVPVFNCERYIAECIKSIRSQTLTSFQALIIDDGCEDNSIQIAKDVIGDDHRFQIISHDKNRGLPTARNTGLKAARGRYVWHVDGDDFLASCALEKMVSRAEADAADIVMTAGRTFPGGRPVRRPPRQPEGPLKFADEPALWSGGGVVLFLFRRRFAETVGNYFPDGVNIGEDKIYLYSILPRAETISFVHDPCYFYRVGVGMTADSLGSPKYLGDVATYIETIRACLRDNSKAWNYNVLSQCEYRADLFVFATEIASREIAENFFRRITRAYKGFETGLVSVPSSQPWQPKITVPAYLRKLYLLLAAGEGQAAEAEVTSLRQCYLHPELTIIKRAMYAARPEEALALAEAFTQRRPLHAVGFHELARVQENLGLFDAAEVSERQALRIDSALARSHLHLSKLLLRRSRTEEAIKHATRAAEFEPDNHSAQVQLGNCFLVGRELGKASSFCEAALRLDSKSAEAICLLSDVQFQRGNLDKALSIVEDEICVFPGDGSLNQTYVQLLLEKKNLREALGAARRWSYFLPYHAKPHIVIGDVLEQLGQLKEAETAYQIALELDPRNPWALKRLS